MNTTPISAWYKLLRYGSYYSNTISHLLVTDLYMWWVSWLRDMQWLVWIQPELEKYGLEIGQLFNKSRNIL